MAAWLRRTAACARFTLQEYVRGGHILAELAAVLALVWLGFWPRSAEGLDPAQVFGLGGGAVLALSVYTAGTLAMLGNRPQGYVLLVRPLGRGGHLTGLYAAALAVEGAAYLLLTLLVVLVYATHGLPTHLTPLGWLLGTLPLLLDLAALCALVLLLSPLVAGGRARLLLAAGIALALSSLDSAPGGAAGAGLVLQPLRLLAGLALRPALDGFALAASRHYDAGALPLLLAQASLVAALLALALWLFGRRDIVLRS